MLYLSGALVVGPRLTVTMRAGGSTMIRPVLQSLEHGTLLRWTGRLGLPIWLCP